MSKITNKKELILFLTISTFIISHLKVVLNYALFFIYEIKLVYIQKIVLSIAVDNFIHFCF
jgi:hypothetical protein